MHALLGHLLFTDFRSALSLPLFYVQRVLLYVAGGLVRVGFTHAVA